MIEVFKDYSIVYNCYKIKGHTELAFLVTKLQIDRIKVGYICNRTYKSYYNEIKGHRRLYNLHLFRKHTKDVDLEENETLFWRIVWGIIGGI